MFGQPAYRQALLNWTAGFLSGANGMAMARDQHFRDLKGLDGGHLIASLRAFCTDNPTAPVVKAAEVFSLSLPLRVSAPAQ